jgi:hypothetical protein
MPFQAGQSGNLNGRTPGTRNKRDAEIWSRLEARGDLDPADFLSSVVTNTKETSELRTQAANMLMPYKYGKRGAIPPPRFVVDLIAVPNFTSVEVAEAYLASLPVMLGKGELDSQTALELSQLIRNWISAEFDHEELQMKLAAHGGYSEQRITIHGGLPPLPGTNITMPVLNADIDGHALPAPSPANANKTAPD